MGTKNKTTCDWCHQEIILGKKYYMVMERIKGKKQRNIQTYCPSCIRLAKDKKVLREIGIID